MFDFINLNKTREWYLSNMAKLLLFFIVVVVISLTAVYIPYLSFILSPGIRLFIIFLCFYLLFPLSINKLVIIAVIAIFFAFIFTILEMGFIAESLGDLLYLLLIFILIGHFKLIVKEKNKF